MYIIEPALSTILGGEHGRAREGSPRQTGGRTLSCRVRPAARRRGGRPAGGPAGGAQRERQAQLEADQRCSGPDESGSLPSVGHDRLFLRVGLSPQGSAPAYQNELPSARSLRELAQ